MTLVAVLGAGAGGLAAVADLTSSGHSVRLWNRSPDSLEPFGTTGVRFEGVLGEGTVDPALVTTDMGEAIDDVDVVCVCLPAIAHSAVAAELARLRVGQPVVLNPGHTGGALHFRAKFLGLEAELPPIAELSTLTYVARKHGPTLLNVSGKAAVVHAASLPGGSEALEQARNLFPAATPVSSVIATDLANVNLVLHPPGALLAAAWVEATGGDFTFYVEGMTPGVARVISRLDRERLEVGRAFGHDLPTLLDEMSLIGTVDREDAVDSDVRAAISSGVANSRIRAPDSLEHRYYTEDFGYGLLPFIEFARIAEVEVPVADALLEIGSIVVGEQLRSTGLNAVRLGIENLSIQELLALVSGP